MANGKVTPKTFPPNDRTAFWSDLAYLPTDYKESRLWMAQSLFAAKLRSQQFLSSDKAIAYRKTDKGEISEVQYKAIFDPPTPQNSGKNLAEYVSADWKAMPVDQHLKNIVEARIRRVLANLVVKTADPVAKLREQKDKEKIILQRFYRNLINETNKELGLPPISESQDPYKYMESFQGNGKDATKKLDEIGDVIDQIRLKVKDEEGMRLFMQYLYKNGIDIAFETAIKFYLLQQNEWQSKWGNYFFTDIRHFNKYCGEWNIDETTGRGMVGYIPPEALYTSPFKDKNGDDILFYFYELPETWANFERLCGAEMSDDDKQAVLKIQKDRGNTAYGYNYDTYQWSNNSFKNDFSITIGRFGVLTQEANAFSEKLINNEVPVQKPQPLDWEPDKDSGEEKKIKTYNVWYTAYYIPLVQASNYLVNGNAPANWEEQAKYVFKIEKVKDMYRYGVDQRYARPPLVIGKDDNKLSFTDVMEAFMPKIHHEWHKFQNYSTQDFQATVFDVGLIQSMLKAVDDANKTEFNEKGQVTGKNADAVIDSWKMMRQAGQAPLNFRNPKTGEPLIDPTKFVFNVGNNLMLKAIECLDVIARLYNEMTKALAISDVGEGLPAQARVPLGATEKSLQASKDAQWAIEQQYGECVIQFAKRVVQHTIAICKEKKAYNYKDRWDELNDVIGLANGATLESLENIGLEKVGLTIENEDPSAKRELVITLATNMLANKEIDEAVLGLILNIDNWKLQIVVLSLAAKDRREELAAKAEADHAKFMEGKQMDLQIAQAAQAAKTQGRLAEINEEGKIEAMLTQILTQLKTQSQMAISDKRTENKIQENLVKSDLKDKETSHKANIEAVAAIA